MALQKSKRVRYLDSGWEDSAFEGRLQAIIDEEYLNGWEYFDIKISSKGNHCMVVLTPARDDGEVES